MIYDLLHIKRPTKGSKSCSYGADTNQSVGNSDINISDCNEKPAYLKWLYGNIHAKMVRMVFKNFI